MNRVGRLSRAGRIVGLCALLSATCQTQPPQAPAADVTQPAATPPGDTTIAPPSRPAGLRPVTLPDIASMNEAAGDQMRTRATSLRERIAGPRATAADIGSAYGELGKLLMAATIFDAAESCYLNAQVLLPADRRWPYYLGHLYKARGPLDKSVASFEQALRLAPTDVATLVWLGDAYLAQDRADAAAPLFAKALTLQPRSAAALFGAGRTALARKDYASAVRDLEAALAVDPQGSGVHYPLAMAYRGRGDVANAEAHLARRGDIEVRPADPLMQELDTLLQSGEALNVRGGRELDAGNWAAAAETFRQGLVLSPNDPSLRHRLGTALYQMGNGTAALSEFEQVIKTSPGFARAHYSRGVILAERGQYAEAADSFTATLTHDPGYVQARVQLARAMARAGRSGEALAEYGRALEQAPTLADATLGYAFTLVRLQRYQEARDRFAEGMKAHPEQSMFAHAYARLLATAPDARVRDGRRAFAVVEQLLNERQTLELGETSAMALAELGQYSQAVRVQRDVIAAAEKAGLRSVGDRLEQNLRLYERGEPCRAPFTDVEMP